MSFKNFIKPNLTKILLSIFIFFLVFLLLTPVCVDPTFEMMQKSNLDLEYFGCHTGLHRYFHFIPDWPTTETPWYVMLPFFLIISYLITCCTVQLFKFIFLIFRTTKRSLE